MPQLPARTVASILCMHRQRVQKKLGLGTLSAALQACASLRLCLRKNFRPKLLTSCLAPLLVQPLIAHCAMDAASSCLRQDFEAVQLCIAMHATHS